MFNKSTACNIFSQKVLHWYSHHKRDLPWRKTDINPYHVVVSEFMLQQTQVPRVMEKFREFTEKFPTIHDLAKTSKADIIQAWSGLGYNRRALLLHKFAQVICEKYEGNIPGTAEELITLPGIGPYTAGSIASFAFNKPEPAIDVNVRRILYRFFAGKDQGLPGSKQEEEKWYNVVKKTIPNNRSRDLHNALMDFGSLVCLRKNPLCSACPLADSCQFFPLYETKKEKVLFVMEKKVEQGVMENGKHIPNRIFRGRIVEFVRKNEGKEAGIEELGKEIKKDYTTNEEEWLLMLCARLKEEGFLEYSKKKNKIKLTLAN